MQNFFYVLRISQLTDFADSYIDLHILVNFWSSILVCHSVIDALSIFMLTFIMNAFHDVLLCFLWVNDSLAWYVFADTLKQMLILNYISQSLALKSLKLFCWQFLRLMKHCEIFCNALRLFRIFFWSIKQFYFN